MARCEGGNPPLSCSDLSPLPWCFTVFFSEKVVFRLHFNLYTFEESLIRDHQTQPAVFVEPPLQ